MSSKLQTPIDYLKGVGPNRANLLRSELGIHTYQDLLNLFPNRYIDKTQYYTISQLQPTSADVQIIGKVTHIKTAGEGRSKRLVATFIDQTGAMELVWFKGLKWIRESLKINVPYVAFGKVQRFGSSYSIAHPDLELLEEHKKGLRIAMQPVYPSTEKLSNRGITNRVMNGLMQTLFQEVHKSIEESLSESIRNALKLIPRREAYLNIHFPQQQEKLAKAQFRLKFEELFLLQMHSL